MSVHVSGNRVKNCPSWLQKESQGTRWTSPGTRWENTKNSALLDFLSGSCEAVLRLCHAKRPIWRSWCSYSGHWVLEIRQPWQNHTVRAEFVKSDPRHWRSFLNQWGSRTLQNVTVFSSRRGCYLLLPESLKLFPKETLSHLDSSLGRFFLFFSVQHWAFGSFLAMVISQLCSPNDNVQKFKKKKNSAMHSKRSLCKLLHKTVRLLWLAKCFPWDVASGFFSFGTVSELL